VSPLGHFTSYETIICRCDPSIPARSIFGSLPQSVQNIHLDKQSSHCPKCITGEKRKEERKKERKEKGKKEKKKEKRKKERKKERSYVIQTLGHSNNYLISASN
jgi:hypothetical protein